MRVMSVSLVFCLVVLCTGLYLTDEKPAWLPIIGDREHVLVFIVPDRRRLQGVFDVADPAHVAARSSGGLAFADGRIAAADAEAASDLINRLGWIDREIELFEPGARSDPFASAGGVPAAAATSEAGNGWLTGSSETKMSVSERRERLRQLSGQHDLSRGQQIFVMRAMADGIEQ
jgi:hypothetical protein